MSGDFCAEFALLAEPLEVVRSDCFSVEYSGSVERARLTRLLEGMPLPGEPGSTRKTQFTLKLGERSATVIRFGDSVRVLFRPSLDERERAYRQWEKRQADAQRAKQLATQIAQVERVLERMERTPEDYCEQVRRDFWSMWCAFEKVTLADSVPAGLVADGRSWPRCFALDEIALDEMRGHIERALWCIQPEVLVDKPSLRAAADRELAGLRREAAALDAPLQTFLGTVRNSAHSGSPSDD